LLKYISIHFINW